MVHLNYGEARTPAKESVKLLIQPRKNLRRVRYCQSLDSRNFLFYRERFAFSATLIEIAGQVVKRARTKFDSVHAWERRGLNRVRSTVCKRTEPAHEDSENDGDMNEQGHEPFRGRRAPSLPCPRGPMAS